MARMAKKWLRGDGFGRALAKKGLGRGCGQKVGPFKVRIGVRMYSREFIDEVLEGLDAGFSTREVAELFDVSHSAVANWARGRIPHARRTGRPTVRASGPPESGTIVADRIPAMEVPVDASEREAFEAAMVENQLLRAVLADLKAGGSSPDSISNRRKTELGERLREATGRSLREITDFLRISKSSYEYHRRRLGRDKYAALRARIVSLFEEGDGNWGYRTIWAHLRRDPESPVAVSEKVVRRIMAEEGLRVRYNKRKAKGWSSYEGEISKAPENLVRRNFHADAPDALWLTDITEFRLPDDSKVYLSPVVDCFDGKPVSWSIGLRPTSELANASLRGAIARMAPGAEPIVHSDRGGHYRWPEWVRICEEAGIVRSMSAKGCSPDNSAMEGFFGRLKNEFFYYRDWEGVSPEEFMERLDAYLEYYCEHRLKRSLGWMSPNEYRRSLGYAL